MSSAMKGLTAQSLKVLADQEKERVQRRLFLALCEQRGIERPEVEFIFAPPRRWRFDYAWKMKRVALEVEGGAWSKGAHGRSLHFLSDLAKYNSATLKGWRLIRCVPGQLLTDDTIQLIKSALAL